MSETYGLNRTWQFLDHKYSGVRPGWWTVKRWVEFMWFRKLAPKGEFPLSAGVLRLSK